MGGFVIEKHSKITITFTIILAFLPGKIAKDDPDAFHQDGIIVRRQYYHQLLAEIGSFGR
jgi:hypothetical protein